ncbi:MAG: pyrimidine/purine nucleoside phosphorylase [Burkholderiales bacterium]
MHKFDNVSVTRKANVYFDGKCVSHTIHFPDGSRKSVGVIFPAKLTFKTAEPEIMEITAGSCRVKLPGETAARTYRAGESFKVPANASFDIEALEPLDYVCHFG